MVKIQRPLDQGRRVFETYISSNQHGNERLVIATIPHSLSKIPALTARSIQRPICNSAKKAHKSTHASASETLSIFDDETILK